ncbi:MAG: glycerol-3-phosphate acyltransferase [Candidatus Pacebacteria bacterium]|nr:glycerol-3-phosphate acyltransferase [Candidatus Paceibacterota bacterium]
MNILEIAMVVASYLIGAIPTGFLLVKKLAKIDVRTVGSGKTGGTNVRRALAKAGCTHPREWAWLVIVIDALKGFAISAIAMNFFRGSPLIIGLSVFLAVLGHRVSPWLAFFPSPKPGFWAKFEGGSGVACFIGVLLPIIAFCGVTYSDYGIMTLFYFLGLIAVWVWILKKLHLMGLASMAAVSGIFIYFVLLSLFTSFSYYFSVTLGICATALLVILNHRKNIIRTWNGKESKTDLL